MPSRTPRLYQVYWDAIQEVQKNIDMNPSAAHGLLALVEVEQRRITGDQRLAEESIAALDAAAAGDVLQEILVKNLKGLPQQQIEDCERRLLGLAQVIAAVKAVIAARDRR